MKKILVRIVSMLAVATLLPIFAARYVCTAEAAPTAQTVFHEQVEISVGGFEDLVVLLEKCYDEFNLVNWTSSNDEIAVVEDDYGRIRAVAEGKATVSATHMDDGRLIATYDIVVKHRYNSDHVCEICGEKYNNGKKIDKSNPYTTHVFCDFEEGGCKICGEEVQFETNIYDISSWWDYVPNDVGVSPKPQKIYFHIKNGILGTLHRRYRYMLSCYSYVAHDEAWHESRRKEGAPPLSGFDMVIQLVEAREVISADSVYPQIYENKLEYQWFPDGRMMVLMPAFEIYFRYSSE